MSFKLREMVIYKDYVYQVHCIIDDGRLYDIVRIWPLSESSFDKIVRNVSPSLIKKWDGKANT